MCDPHAPAPDDEAVAEFLLTMNGGHYLIFAEAIRQLGGELRIRPQDFASAAMLPKPGMEVDGTDGVVALRLAGRLERLALSPNPA